MEPLGSDLPFGPLLYRIDREDIVLLCSVMECYEDMGEVRTVDKERALVEILYAPDLYEDTLAVLEGIRREIPSLERVIAAP